MVEEPNKKDSPKRWPRGQRFTLTPSGQAARAALAEAISAARTSQGGREAQDAAVGGWANQHGVKPGDGNCLDELVGHDRNVAELAEALLSSGFSRPDVQAAVDRMVTAQLVAAVPKADTGGMSPGPSSPPYR